MTLNETENEAEKSRRYGKKTLIYMLSAFLIVCSVNAFFIYKAITTYPGQVTDNTNNIPHQNGK